MQNQASDIVQENLEKPSDDAIVTTVEKGRVVAHVSAYGSATDAATEAYIQSKSSVEKFEVTKPKFRSIARSVLNSLFQKGVAVKAVFIHGSHGNFAEVCPSNTKKTLPKELVDEAIFRKENNLLSKELVVTLTGPLADWAFKNMPALSNIGPEKFQEHFKASEKNVVSDSFMKFYNDRIQTETDTDVRNLLDKLYEAGFNSPAVEIKGIK